ncbi:MAG: glycosyltransferase family 2 protein [Bacillota bacterium]
MLSVVIPCYNKADVLENTIESLNETLKLFNDVFEIILVVEKCTDNTLELSRMLENKYSHIRVIENDIRYGKGYTIKRGILNSTGDYILAMDADLPVDLGKYLPIMRLLIDGPKVAAVYATAISDKSNPGKRGILRALVSFFLFGLRRWLLGQDISDSQLGCKLYKGQVVRGLMSKLRENGFLYEIHLTDLLVLSGYHIEECAVRISNFDQNSSVNIKSIISSGMSFFNYLLYRRRKLFNNVSVIRPFFLRATRYALLFGVVIAAYLCITTSDRDTAYAAKISSQAVILETGSLDNVATNQVIVYGRKKSHPR